MARILDCAEKALPLHPIYRSIAEHLSAYQKSGKNWDEYRSRISLEVQGLLARILRDCRRNGFIGPKAVWSQDQSEYRITWTMVVERTSNYRNQEERKILKPTPCSLCERECRRKDSLGVFIPDSEPCWKGRDAR